MCASVKLRLSRYRDFVVPGAVPTVGKLVLSFSVRVSAVVVAFYAFYGAAQRAAAAVAALLSSSGSIY